MTSQNDTTLFNIFNSLGYLFTLFAIINVLIGWLPILICFNSPHYSIGWNGGMIARWAFLELLFFGGLAVAAVGISVLRLDLRHLPAGWHFLRLLSVWPTTDEAVRFGRGGFHPNQGVHAMNNEHDDDRGVPAGRPGRYSSVAPSTTVTDKKVGISNLLPIAIEHHLEGWREDWEKKQVERQTETLRTKTEANRARGEYFTSQVDWQYAEANAHQRHDLDKGRYLREAAEIKRDIENIKNPPKDQPPKPKRSYADEIAEKLRKQAFGHHEGIVEDQIREHAKQWGGEENAPEEVKAFYRRLRADAAQRDQGRG